MVLPVLAQVELILSIAALTKGLYVVVAMSLIGSILSNLLLVMGAQRTPDLALLPASFCTQKPCCGPLQPCGHACRVNIFAGTICSSLQLSCRTHVSAQ